jgi:hypothetical protein
MQIKHKHHIVPKHMGGSDTKSNIISLSVKEHADAHRILYEEYGKMEDYLAWKGLEGSINLAEINYIKSVLSGKKQKGRVKSPEECKKISDSWTKERKEQLVILSKLRFSGKKKSKEHVDKLKSRKKNKRRNTKNEKHTNKK